MKTTKLIRGALFTAILAVFALVGCEKMDTYSIDAPADLQSEIDSIAAAKASVDTGDTTYIEIATAIVGAEDYSSAWNTAFSDYFTIPANEKLVLEFINHNGGSADNWNNWTLAVANVADRDADNYEEYFALRADAYGWGNGDFDLGIVSHNYPDTDGDEDIWDDFRETMDGAHVTIEIDHSVSGYAFFTATAVGTNGTELVMTYQQPVSATEDIVAFLIADASYFEIQEAYLLPSVITTVEDVEPASIEITGAPEFVEIGNENFWGNAVATVTFADGSSEQVDTADISISVPDMTTLGEKTVIVSYNKTKQGEYTDAVSTYYTLEVSNSVSSIELTSMPDITTYYYYETDTLIFDPQGMVVTATYADGTTGILEYGALDISKLELTEGAQDVVVSFEGETSTSTTTIPINLVQGIGQIGASDFSTGFWGEISSDYTVAPNTSETITFYTYSAENETWNCAITPLRNADNSTEYAVTRMDNAGWGDYGFGTAVLSNDWNMDTFIRNISGSKVVLTVTNNGDDTADVRYDVTYANGETHFQLHEGITVDSSDLNFALTVENCYHVIVE